ncbi:hypothetical protein FN846DRAFT_919979 [Sphaerosporella brunnea]|uniref:Uncharacterized protein n=1 Tax=Sphaerosporella brunnea TaxID=1250544 RepID=A0A5J5EV89_9PEZI|nr:hypothetical protein FN846DRAFT_919979 [Sphaerosporella brunnea]
MARPLHDSLATHMSRVVVKMAWDYWFTQDEILQFDTAAASTSRTSDRGKTASSGCCGRHVKKAAAVPTLDNLPHELILEIGKSLTASSNIYHLMQTCRTMRAILDKQLYSTAVRGSHRLKLVQMYNHAAVRRLLATAALAVDLEFYRYVGHGFVECTQMLNVAIELKDEPMVRLLVEAGCSLFCVRISPAAAQRTALGRLLKERGVPGRPTGAPTGWEWMMEPFTAGRPVVSVSRVPIDADEVDYTSLVRWELPL